TRNVPPTPVRQPPTFTQRPCRRRSMAYGLRPDLAPEHRTRAPPRDLRERERERGSVGFGAPAVVKKPLCQPLSLAPSLTRNQISKLVAGCCQRRSALRPMNSACRAHGIPLARSGGFACVGVESRVRPSHALGKRDSPYPLGVLRGEVTRPRPCSPCSHDATPPRRDRARRSRGRYSRPPPHRSREGAAHPARPHP